MTNLNVPANAAAWTPPDFADLERVSRALAEVAPEAEPIGPLRVLGEGFFSVAVATASKQVFRLGTAPGVMARYRKEWRLLPWLRDQGLPLAVPEPRWLIEPSAAFPFGGTGYSMLAGVPMMADVVARGDRARLVGELAGFLLALHRIPLDELAALDLPDLEVAVREFRQQEREAALTALPVLLSGAEMRRVEAWWSAPPPDPAASMPPVLLHDDIGDENLLAAEDGTRLLGVIDWEHAAIGEPTHEFANSRYLGAEFQAELVAVYVRLGGRVPADVDARLAWRWQHGAFPGIRRKWQRGEMLDAAAVRTSLRRHGVLDGSER